MHGSISTFCPRSENGPVAMHGNWQVPLVGCECAGKQLGVDGLEVCFMQHRGQFSENT